MAAQRDITAMVTVTVQYLGMVRNLAGVPSERVALPSRTADVRTLLRRLEGTYGDEFTHYVLADEYRLSSLARLLVDDVDVEQLPAGYGSPLTDGAVVRIVTVTPLSGG